MNGFGRITISDIAPTKGLPKSPAIVAKCPPKAAREAKGTANYAKKWTNRTNRDR